MKGDRRLKKLALIGVKARNKPHLSTEPSNRAERRALARAVRKGRDSK